MLKSYLSQAYTDAKADLATGMVARWQQQATSCALVTPQNWLTGARHTDFRQAVLTSSRLVSIVWLGSGAFRSISGEVVQPLLVVVECRRPDDDESILMIDNSSAAGIDAKESATRTARPKHIIQSEQLHNPDYRIIPTGLDDLLLLSTFANAWQGIASSDYPRFGRAFWELPSLLPGWRLQQSTVKASRAYGGRENILYWQNGYGAMTEVCQPGAPFRGKEAWGRPGVVVSQMGSLPVTIYTGECFDNNTAVITLNDTGFLPAVWAFARSEEFCTRVRQIDQGMKVTNSTLVKVPFDVERWRAAAEEKYPDGLPEPWSDDPTQWLFEGRPEVATEPLQVAVGRLVGFRWPEQAESDDLDVLADADGIVCLPSVLGEPSAADRLREVLARAFGGTWSPMRAAELLASSGSKKTDLDSWLREDFFKAHCQVFRNRPFVWHIWDGRKDGFAALVNYHRLDHHMLQRLAYTYLGDWIERQTAGVRDDVAGAEERFAAAQDLQRRLQLILDGEPPYDIYVRWKSVAEQPIGWDPDLNDGVRLNVRPFVEAGALRAKFNVKWDKDRGKNPDGSERHNNLHYTRAEKQVARRERFQ